MKILGLTGGIGMGKTTVAGMLRSAGMPVFDADEMVHRLQAQGGAALPAIAQLVPAAVTGSGALARLDRAALRQAVIHDDSLIRGLERIMHPLVRAGMRDFLTRERRRGTAWVVLDIPLLFEGDIDRQCDYVIVVSAPLDVQIRRVVRRGKMNAAQAARLIQRQMPDREKRRRADGVIDTGLSLALTRAQVRALIRDRLHARG